MRKKLFFMVLCCLSAMATFAKVPTITWINKEEAVSRVKTLFANRDMDYYIRDNGNEWMVFVDADPMKGWPHQCFIADVPMIETSSSEGPPFTITKYDNPPDGDFEPVDVKNRYGNNANSKPSVRKASQTNAPNPVAGRTYAVILSGGINKNANYERYWNDCSFIYQTLVNKYGIPKSNIYPIMSDGADPAEDMRCTTGGYKSQPLDLDFDGVAEIKLAATKANVKNTLKTLEGKLKKDDHLFFFVIDHGGSDDFTAKSYICLWNNERLYDTELASMLEPFSKKYANINVVLGQCYAGGFNAELTKTGCVVAAASLGSESSWACPDIPYDEFVYQWTSAINEATHTGAKVVSDTDNNGRVTMEEAFNYAKLNDRRTAEHPQYVSTPISVGEDLAFNNLAPSIDLYIKDSPEDTGKEPNKVTVETWKSPSVWVRNQPDGIYEHENPVYSTDHRQSFVYVRVHNRGKEDYVGTNKYLFVYWADASTDFPQGAWKGRVRDSNDEAGGGLIYDSVQIGEVPAGEYIELEVPWSLPNKMNGKPEGKYHFCLMTRILDTWYDDGYVDGKIYFNPRAYNDQAQKNVTIIRKEDLSNGIDINVRNVSSTGQSYTLELIPQTDADASLYTRATVDIVMGTKIYEAWKRGGSTSEFIVRKSSNANPNNAVDLNRTVTFTSTASKLKSINLNAGESDVVNVKFNFTKYALQSTKYTFDLVQKDEEGNIIGGETFIVESPSLLVGKPVEINTNMTEDGKYLLSAINADEFKSIEWRNEQNETLGTEDSVTVTPKLKETEYTVVATTEEGDVATNSITLAPQQGIKTVVANADARNVVVTLLTNAPEDASVTITSATDTFTNQTQPVPSGTDTVSLDSANLTNGIYIVTYFVGDEKIDQRKVTLK